MKERNEAVLLVALYLRQVIWEKSLGGGQGFRKKGLKARGFKLVPRLQNRLNKKAYFASKKKMVVLRQRKKRKKKERRYFKQKATRINFQENEKVHQGPIFSKVKFREIKK